MAPAPEGKGLIAPARERGSWSPRGRPPPGSLANQRSEQPLKIGNRRLQPRAQRHLGRPPQVLTGQGDVRLALARVVLRQGLMHQCRARAGQILHRLGQFQHGELTGIAQVHRPGQIIGTVHQAHKALDQCLFDVNWGELDYLFVDLPPGTGDVHLTLAQSTTLAGAIIVSTPQDVGLTIARKTLRMFQQTGVRLLGILENMSFYNCSHCGSREHLFGNGTVAAAAAELEIPYLGEIPLEMAIREAADAGMPVILKEPASASAAAYREIIGKVAQQVSISSFDPVILSAAKDLNQPV